MDIEKILQNPEIVQIHREPARAYYIPFQDGAMALQADKEESVYYAPLGGDWAFAYYGRSYDVDEAIFDPDGSVEGWDTIPVPPTGRCTATTCRIIPMSTISFPSIRLTCRTTTPAASTSNP